MGVKTPKCRISLTHFFLHTLQNDTEKSASEPGTPPHTSKTGDLKSTSKSPKTSPKTSPQVPKSPEVKCQNRHFQICMLTSVVSTPLETVSLPTGGGCHNSPSTSRVTQARGQSHDPWREVGPHAKAVRRGGRRGGVGLHVL